MKNNLFLIFSQGFQSGFYKRIGGNQNLCLYIGKDEKGNYAFEFRGKYIPERILGSDVISLSQTKSSETYVLRFALENNELLEYFCTFCQDLLDSTIGINNDEVAYKTLCSRYFSWKKLFKPHSGKLSDLEIIGLIGELLFLQDHLIQEWGIAKSVESWTGPEKTHKDFSIENKWYEVKTINSGKDSVKISSLEQLDGETEGYLAIYCLEKMSPSFNGIKLNSLIMSLMNKMSAEIRELFISKLNLYNYDFSPEYDNFVYSLVGFSLYIVKDDFPRLCRKNISTSLTKVQYEIILSELENYKL
jgi:hypothetical protein